MHHAVEQRPLLPGLLNAVADHDEGARQDLQVLAVASELVHAALDVGIELLSIRKAAAAGEHGFRGLGRELPAVIGRAGLHDHRPALHRARDVEGTAHREVFSLVIEHMHLVGIENRPVSTSRTKASSAKEFQRPVTTS